MAKNLLARCLIAGLVVQSAPTTAIEPAGPVDSRKIYSSEAPAWLRAVGKLRVPGSTFQDGHRAHLREDCSATLVTSKAGSEANTIITAWHCLANYNDLSRPIIFTLVSGLKDEMKREAYRLADGGGMHADWAILRLKRPVATGNANALLVHPGRANPVRAIAMAGYSRDAVMGDYGNHLTFDPACLITGEEPAISDSNCKAYKGASGGAVVQISAAGAPLFSGVISEGDSVGFSTFVPVGLFRGALNQHLR